MKVKVERIDKLYVARYGYDTEGNVIYDTDEAGLKNTLLQQYLRVLLTKDNTSSLKLSIDNATDNVKAILKDIEGSSTFHPEPFEVYSPTYQEARKAEYTGGKAGIGPFALNNAHHILTQLTKLHMVSNDFTEAMGITDVSGIFDVPTEHNPRGGRILDWLSAMINAFVDIAKDPYIVRLNVNGWTYNMVSFLLRTGKGRDTFYFMYQPVLREMAQEVLKTKGKYGIDRTKTPSQLENEAIERVLDKYDPDKSRRKKYGKINKDNILAAETYAPLFQEQELDVNGVIEYTTPLRQAIKDPEAIGNFNDFQVRVYYAWKALKPYADSLANLVKYSKIDTKKTGKTFAEQLNYYDGMQRLLDDPNFEPGAIRRFYDETFVGHKTDNAILFGSGIFSNKLLRNTELFSNQKDAILSLLGRKGLADSALLKSIISGMEAQIKSKFFTQFAKDNGIDVTQMFKGKVSIAKQLNNFKESIRKKEAWVSHLIDNNGNITNDFIEFLLPNIENVLNNSDGLDFIDTSELLNVDQAKANNLINYWRELIEDPNPQINKLFKDLAVYAFIVSGDNSVMNGFFQYLPNSYRISIGYRDYMRNVLDQYSNNSSLNYADKDDFFRNNWTNDKLVKPVAMYTRKGTLETISYNSSTPNMIAGLRNGEVAIRPNNWVDIEVTRGNNKTIESFPIFPPYIKYNDGLGNNPSNWHLYTLVGFGTNNEGQYYPVYGLIGKKGYRHRGHTVTEYGVQTQFNFNRETEWNYNEAVNNPEQLAAMSDNYDVWRGVGPITNLASYKDYNYMQQNPQTVIEEDVENGETVLEEKEEPNNIQPQTSTETINIYAGANENADLSNLAVRPFTHLDIQFQSVEQAFQFYKTEFSPKNEYNHAVGQAIMTTTSGRDLRRLGRSFKGLNQNAWDQMAPTIMKQLILDSFTQNPEAAQRLLSTGNATLTHLQESPKSRWRTEFPRLLMEVREQLRQSQNTRGFQGYVGGFSNEGKGTVQGDGKDKAMREIANGFIGELSKSPYKKQGDKFVLKDPDSSTFTSLVTIMKRGHNPGTYEDGTTYEGQVSYNLGYQSGGKMVMAVSNRDLYDEGWIPTTIMLARNSELRGTPLESDTKVQIKQFADKGVHFVVGDMPDVDSQFIEYLQEIGANFTIYHTGTASRINVQSNQQTIQSMDDLLTTNQKAIDLMQKHQYAMNKIKPIIESFRGDITDAEVSSYYDEFNSLFNKELENGNLNTQEQIDGFVNKFICNL